jgi:vacuolar-type H+-ATPase subunit F/Vma7
MAAVPTGVPVRISLSGNELPTKDLLSKTDPFCVLYQKLPSGQLHKIGVTEALRNNENPKFTTTFPVDYVFESIQEFRVEVYDSDSDLSFHDLSQHDKIGHVDFHLANVLGAYGSSSQFPILKANNERRSKGTITVRADILTQSRLKAVVTIRGDDFKRGSYLASKDETILQFVRIRPDYSQVVIYASEIVWDSQDPKYPPFKVCLGQLCDGDVNKEFIIRIIRWKNASKQELLGEVKTTPANIAKQPNDPTKKKLDIFEDGKKRGTVIVEQFVIREEASFLDYIQAGLDFSLTIAIDATGSNGDPKTPTSLHYVDYSGKKPNAYIDGLRSVGNVVTHYCQKQWVAALGYGGFASIDGAAPITSHCFPLTLSSQYAYVDGIEGVVRAYVDGFATGRIQLSGPTYFADIIKSATQTAMRPYTHDYQHYNVLLIFTDGIINDMDATIDAIVDASSHPLSIIIVGVGNADFSGMNVLDGDDKVLRSKKHGASKRDLVQFVPYNKFANNLAELARVTLAEIPNQVLDFMNLHNIKPAVRQPQVMLAAPPPQHHQQQMPPQ